MATASGQYTIIDLNDVTVAGVAPATPVTGQLWMDTSITPNALKIWSGTAWTKTGDTNYIGQTDSSTLVTLLQNLSQDERGLILTGVGGVFTLIVGPEEIQFWQNDVKVAYISSEQLYINSANLVAEMKIGNYIMKKTADGGLVFM